MNKITHSADPRLNLVVAARKLVAGSPCVDAIAAAAVERREGS